MMKGIRKILLTVILSALCMTNVPAADLTEVEKEIMAIKDVEDPAGAKYGDLQLKQKTVTQSAIILKWNPVSNAKEYVIYGNKFSVISGYQKITSTTDTTYRHDELTKNSYYRYIVVAVDEANQVLTVSPAVYITTKGSKMGNHKGIEVKLKKKNPVVKKGKKLKLKAKPITSSRSIKVRIYRDLRYESTNTKIAKVSKNGVIKGISKGKCYVYIIAQNGKSVKIKVKVK